jgi:hypothetical protein
MRHTGAMLARSTRSSLAWMPSPRTPKPHSAGTPRPPGSCRCSTGPPPAWAAGRRVRRRWRRAAPAPSGDRRPRGRAASPSIQSMRVRRGLRPAAVVPRHRLRHGAARGRVVEAGGQPQVDAQFGSVGHLAVAGAAAVQAHQGQLRRQAQQRVGGPAAAPPAAGPVSWHVDRVQAAVGGGARMGRHPGHLQPRAQETAAAGDDGVVAGVADDDDVRPRWRRRPALAEEGARAAEAAAVFVQVEQHAQRAAMLLRSACGPGWPAGARTRPHRPSSRRCRGRAASRRSTRPEVGGWVQAAGRRNRRCPAWRPAPPRVRGRCRGTRRTGPGVRRAGPAAAGAPAGPVVANQRDAARHRRQVVHAGAAGRAHQLGQQRHDAVDRGWRGHGRGSGCSSTGVSGPCTPGSTRWRERWLRWPSASISSS